MRSVVVVFFPSPVLRERLFWFRYRVDHSDIYYLVFTMGNTRGENRERGTTTTTKGNLKRFQIPPSPFTNRPKASIRGPTRDSGTSRKTESIVIF